MQTGGLAADVSGAERQRLIETRRDLHRNPEIAFRETRTAGIVAERLSEAGYSVRTGVGGTGVVGELQGDAGDGPLVLLRADMDALPVHEETEHDFRSGVDGMMHACGHDGHVAVLLAVAERLAQARTGWGGAVRLLFQPAEEIGAGAKRMIDEGVLDGVSTALGLHLWLGLPSGVIGVVDGPLMASTTDWEAEIVGRGGHGAIPDETVDAVVVGSQVVVALQSVVARTVSPLESAVVSVGAFQAGSASNVIAGTATLRGTIRAFDPKLTEELPRRVESVIAGVCAALGATYRIRFMSTVVPVINDTGAAAMVRLAAEEVVGPERVRTDPAVRTMAAEDFGFILRRVPGCFFFVGAQNEARGIVHPHHSPRFDLCEEALPVAVAVLERAARTALAARGG